MRCLAAVVRRNLQKMKKSSKVADENMFEAGNVVELPIFGGNNRGTRQRGWNVFSLIYTILHAPISILSCVSNPHVNASDGVWASGELAQISEMNHLMVNDSLRYAILM
ncbi:uncharacterized protein LOC133295994 [Gastrolobium bilobum]|uniref:uncharacterized protein LOC133295994 n=1 Tax=Gastrolobium bilobum TaxID=150636 RepID=UPI002AB303A8|nr:uncharacterized protein LOC133295994 [Gastrolobium bilobum]